jgi:hypothetical protein
MAFHNGLRLAAGDVGAPSRGADSVLDCHHLRQYAIPLFRRPRLFVPDVLLLVSHDCRCRRLGSDAGGGLKRHRRIIGPILVGSIASGRATAALGQSRVRAAGSRGHRGSIEGVCGIETAHSSDRHRVLCPCRMLYWYLDNYRQECNW